jgi:general secretion pathway protein D
MPDCDEVRRKAKFNVYFDKVEIEKLVQTVSNATCRTFILGDNVRGKISIIGPDNGKVEVSPEQFYAAFLAALDANQLAVVPYGRFSKIVEKAKAKQNAIPFVTPDEEYTTNEQMVTRMFKVRYADLEPLRAVVQQLVSQNGDSIPFQPDTLIVNDLGSNMHRLEKIIEQLDSRSSSDEMRVIRSGTLGPGPGQHHPSCSTPRPTSPVPSGRRCSPHSPVPRLLAYPRLPGLRR